MSTPQPIPAPVLLEQAGPVARLTINRPPLNILDTPTLHELNRHIVAAFNAPAIRLLEIQGAGEKAFSAGAEVRDHYSGRVREMLREFHSFIRAIVFAPVPTLALVRGHCLGGGMEVVLACDFALAATDSVFGQPEIRLGAFPPVAAALLSRLVGEKKAMEIILGGVAFGAEEACRLGLVNKVVAPEDLDSEVDKFEEALISKSAPVIAMARKATRQGFREEFETRLREAERIYLEELLGCEDAMEGIKAFLEKRPPVWRGK